jgi:hypothetical protein
MLETFRAIAQWLQQITPSQRAKVTAYWIAPGSILFFTLAGVFGNPLALDPARPVAVAELNSTISATSGTETKHGFAIIVEPVPSEFRIQLASPLPYVWSSLDETSARANSSRIILDKNGGLLVRSPFFGAPDPVTFVVEGRLGPLHVPGSQEKVDHLLIKSRRSNDIMTCVLIACIFAFGMSSSSGLPVPNKKKNARS